jgi:AcrR family transcriptional regulator
MARWQPGARERLVRSAVELFQEQGFADTTVPEIAARAGVTNRTFFRYFGDKREVLFSNEDQTAAELRATLAQAPANLGAAGFIIWGLRLMAAERFGGRRDEMRLLRRIIDSDEGLRERALSKRRTMSVLLGDALYDRGLCPAQAQLLAETSLSALDIAIGNWLERDDGTGVDVLTLEALDTLRVHLDGVLQTARSRSSANSGEAPQRH